MDAIILDDIPFEADMKQLMEKLRLKEGTAYADRLQDLVNEAEAIAKPKALYREASLESKEENFVMIEGKKITSRVVRVNLETSEKFFPYIATCGEEMETWSNSFTDMLEKFWVDAIKEMALRVSRDYLRNHIKENYQLDSVSSMNPGSLGDWPMREQKNLFALLGNPKESIGVELTESFLMFPVKSVSGIWFPGESFENCQLCQKNCPNRRAPFDPHLYDEKYSSDCGH